MPNSPHSRSHLIIKSFEAKALKRRNPTTRIADFLTSFFGGIVFLSANLILYGFWVLANSGKIPGITPFDPFPFSFLNSTVGFEALILTIIVLVSQNSSSRRDVLRNELGLQVELIIEKEITKILQLLKQKKEIAEDHELEDMTKEIDASYIERKLEEQLEEGEKLK